MRRCGNLDEQDGHLILEVIKVRFINLQMAVLIGIKYTMASQKES